MPIFDWLAQHPEEAKHFSQTMATVHGAEPPAIAAAYDFSSCSMIVDVGSASGNLRRAAGEFESLLARAGLKITRVVPTTTSASIVEAEAS
jgi:hypothetical protein